MAPLPARATLPPKDHIVRFYETDSFLCDMVGRYLAEGLELGEPCVVLATEGHRHGIERVLTIQGAKIAQAKEKGLLNLVDAEEILSSFMVGGLDRGMVNPEAFREVVGGLLERASFLSRAGSTRAYGEMVDLLLRRGNEAAMARIEELWNELRSTHSFQLYCSYRLGHFAREEHQEPFQRICEVHGHVLPAESFDASASLEERHRQIAKLQQRARALETEVAERKQLDRALRAEREHLREANRRKDEFLAMLGHELRNPLNPILTALDLMDMRGDEHSRREREIIRRQAMHLAGLIEDLLDVSRVTGGKITLRREPTEIASVIARAIEMASPLLEQRAHLLTIAVPQRGLLVEADPIRLPQIFANLLMNAAKYTERGGHISVAARQRDGEIETEVRDDGIGIAPELLATIFEPFVQGSRSLDRAEGGLGLGLALVRSLTRLHGGTVSAQSDGLGKGSCFTVRLPVLCEVPRTQLAKSADPSGPAAPPEKLERVLIVDDNADCALGFAEALRLLGHHVEVAFDGPRALTVAAEFKPTVALIDIGLPVMDGYELARKLRQAARSRPVKLIAVTGYGEDANRAMSLEAGFDIHTVKPLGLESLRNLLERENGDR